MIRNMLEKECQRMPGYYGWVSKLNKCIVVGPTKEPCNKVWMQEKRIKNEEVCQNITQSQSLEDDWGAIWGSSLLETYSYLGTVNWCIQWTGSKNQTHTNIHTSETAQRVSAQTIDIWNCSRVITCDTPEAEIGLILVRVLLK